ncbi:MAG: hypothetical protein VYC19_05210 [Pseudomonadota bacterium]|jgi:hypothetical protein|nr:hypothetical protein [Pseudomonadota bacterium]
MALGIVREFNAKFEKKYPEYALYAQENQPAKTGENWLNAHYHNIEDIARDSDGLSLKKPSDFAAFFERAKAYNTDGQVTNDKRLDGPAVSAELDYQQGSNPSFK